MGSFIGKLKEFVGIPSPEDYEYIEDFSNSQDENYSDVYDPLPEQPPLEDPEAFRNQSDTGAKAGAGINNVVGMPGASRFWGSVAEVLVMEPRAFEEMPQVIQSLRERKSVVLNLSLMEPAQAQRAVDFVAGATFTIDGHQERVGENIFSKLCAGSHAVRCDSRGPASCLDFTDFNHLLANRSGYESHCPVERVL
jgi:cell division inhibitor SepF